MPDSTLASKVVFQRGQEYLEGKLEYGRLKATEKAADLSGSVILAVIIAFIAVGLLFILSVTAAMALGKWTHSQAEGFFLVGAFYGILLLLVYLFRTRLIMRPVSNVLLKKLMK